jgi:hypothetical protein
VEVNVKSFMTLGVILSVVMVLLDGCQPTPIEDIDTPAQTASVMTVVDTLLPATPTPESVSAIITPSIKYDSSYSESDPLQDLEKIFEILESLRQLELRGVAEPGWYLHYHLPENDGNFSFLVHVIDSQRTCKEQMVFTKKGDLISPYLIMNETEVTGIVDYQGKVRPLKTYISTCNLEDPRSMGMLGPYDYILSGKLAYYQNEIDLMSKGQTTPGKFSAWFDHYEGEEVFIVRFHLLGTGIWKNSNGEDQSILDQSSYDEFDLDNGRLLRTRQVTVLDNGEVIHMETKHYLTYYPKLPAELQSAFDQAVAGLEVLNH